MEWFKDIGGHLKNLGDIPPLLFLANLELEQWAVLTTIFYTVTKTAITIANFLNKKKEEQKQDENNLSNKRT